MQTLDFSCRRSWPRSPRRLTSGERGTSFDPMACSRRNALPAVAFVALSLGCANDEAEPKEDSECYVVETASVVVEVLEDDVRTPVPNFRIAYWPTNAVGDVLNETTTDSAGFAILSRSYRSAPGSADGLCRSWTLEYGVGPGCTTTGTSCTAGGRLNGLNGA